jgi:hypothetical protein
MGNECPLHNKARTKRLEKENCGFRKGEVDLDETYWCKVTEIESKVLKEAFSLQNTENEIESHPRMREIIGSSNRRRQKARNDRIFRRATSSRKETHATLIICQVAIRLAMRKQSHVSLEIVSSIVNLLFLSSLQYYA